jgi:C1A family cysteine protease
VQGAWVSGKVDAESTAKAPTNHAVLAVGVSGEASPDSIIVKNSWGVKWGDSGYGTVTKRYVETFTLRAHALELNHGNS